jgi:hypothetical protein
MEGGLICTTHGLSGIVIRTTDNDTKTSTQAFGHVASF